MVTKSQKSRVGCTVDPADPIGAAAERGAEAIQILLGDPQSWNKPATLYPDGPEALKKAVREFLTVVPTADEVTLLGFNDNIYGLARRETNPGERIKAVERLRPFGGTALYDVIIRSADLLDRKRGRKAMIVFTDGEDQGSHATIEEAEKRLQASDATVYLIGEGRGQSMEPLKKIMRRLSAPTGGRAIFTERIDELRGALALIPARTCLLPIEGAGHDLRRGRFDFATVVTEFLKI